MLWLTLQKPPIQNLSPATYIVNTLNNHLDAQREAVLGPDLVGPPQRHAFI